MIIYVFDNSFEGFLTCVYEAYYGKRKPSKIIRNTDLSNYYNLIDEFITIETDESKSRKVYNAIERDFSSKSFTDIYSCYLSDISDIFTVLFKFIVLGFKIGKEVDMHLHNPIVMEVHKTSRKVFLESHRFLGFVRFTPLNNKIFYSSIEPDHNILPLIGDHFKERFSSMDFIIHDLKRELAIFYIDKEYIIGSFTNHQELQFINELSEDKYSEFWKTYVKSASIKNRENKKLQNRMMPRRYWKNLTEASIQIFK